MSEEPPSPGIAISVVIQDRAWQQHLTHPEILAEQASRATVDEPTLESPLPAFPSGAELSIVLGDDALVHGLNRRYRRVDRTTNVLSFANLDSSEGSAPDAPELLGDVVLARETIEREAREQGKSTADHLSHLVVHGVLHLLGYDHQSDRDADRMEHLERIILGRLGIADPYRDQDRVPRKLLGS